MSAVSNPQASDARAPFGWTLLAAAVTAIGLPTSASAEGATCDVRLAQTPETVRILYDPFLIARPPGRFDLRLANDGGEVCDLVLRIRDIGGRSLETLDLGGVTVELRAREGAALVGGVGGEPGVFRLRLPPGEDVVAQLDAVVVRDAVAEAGEHAVDLFAEVGPNIGDPTIRGVPFTVVLESPPRAQLNIAGAAGAFGSGESVEVIDFGTASTGATKRAFLQIRANTDSRLTIQSQNGGVLQRPGDTSEQSVIQYMILLDGASSTLTHPITRQVDPPRDLNGQSLSLDFVLGPVGSQMSGRYEDLVTINISPN